MIFRYSDFVLPPQSEILVVPWKCADRQMHINMKTQCITCAPSRGNPQLLGTWVCHCGPPHLASAWGKSVWGVGLNVKGKRCRRREMETCNRPTHPVWAQRGNPSCLYLSSSKVQNTPHITLMCFFFQSIDAIYTQSQRWHPWWNYTTIK